MNIAIAATYDVTNVKFWSGIPFYIFQILEKYYNVTPVQVTLKRPIQSLVKGFYYNRIINKQYFTSFDSKVFEYNSKYLDDLFLDKFEVIITFDYFLVPFISKYAKKNILITDATFDNLLNYYDYRSNLCMSNIIGGHALQQEAFSKLNYVLYSSNWAINSAVNKYNADREKLRLLFYGSNLSLSLEKGEVSEIIKRRLSKSMITLFFPAVYWDRKGGDLAIAIVNNLNQKGFVSKLIVAGTKIPESLLNDNIEDVGYLDKRVPEHEAKLIECYKDATFLIMPTRADCTPVVFSEANSFALPIITSITGGIQTIVNEENNNGVAFELDDRFIDRAVNYIVTTIQDPEFYEDLCWSCYEVYHQKFSWAVGEKRLNDVIVDVSIYN